MSTNPQDSRGALVRRTFLGTFGVVGALLALFAALCVAAFLAGLIYAIVTRLG